MRSRYSQALTDVKLLHSGEDYKTLPDYISIWILPYDPFGKNQMLYTVKNVVEDFPELVYNDGVALGREEGREEGIWALISSLKELDIPDEQILNQLMKNFFLTMEEANAYLNEKC